MGANKLLDARNIEVQCPNTETNCRGKIKVSLNQIRRGRTVVCPHCGVNIHLQEQGNGISGMEKALKDFERSLSRTFNITIKL